MIIACPACQTRYVVPDNAIGVEGRTVRCAKCKHSWFQDGASAQGVAESDAVAPSAPPPPPPPAPPVEETAPEAPAATESEADVDSRPAPEEPPAPEPSAAAGQDDLAEDAPEPAPPPPQYEEPAPAADEPPAPDAADSYDYDEASRFDYEPPFKPRRNPLKIWTAAGVIFATLVFGTIAAVSFWGAPDWLPINRPVFALQEPDLTLDFPAEQMDRRTLANGTEYFGTSGTVTNTGRATRDVPPILIVLRDRRDRIVYSWEVIPSKRTLAPGESVRINEAVTDVPRSAAFAEIGWKPR